MKILLGRLIIQREGCLFLCFVFAMKGFVKHCDVEFEFTVCTCSLLMFTNFLCCSLILSVNYWDQKEIH